MLCNSSNAKEGVRQMERGISSSKHLWEACTPKLKILAVQLINYAQALTCAKHIRPLEGYRYNRTAAPNHPYYINTIQLLWVCTGIRST